MLHRVFSRLRICKTGIWRVTNRIIIIIIIINYKTQGNGMGTERYRNACNRYDAEN